MTNPITFGDYSTQLREFIRGYSSGVSDAEFCKQSKREFNELALALFGLQFEHVPIYRRFCERRRATLKSVLQWDQIPALPISAFKEFEVSSLNLEQRTAVFHSSGTTVRTPSRHFHDIESLQIYETSLLASFRWHLLGDIEDLIRRERLGPLEKLGFVTLTPSSALAPQSSLAHMFETVRSEFGSNDSIFVGTIDEKGAWVLDLERTVFALREAIRSNRPIVLLGTAFSFVHLLDHLAANNMRYRLAEGSRVMETGGYKGRSRSIPKVELHSLVTEYLGVPETHIVCEYGMSELSSQAYDHSIADCRLPIANSPTKDRSSRNFRFPPWARARVVSPETGLDANDGEAGLIHVFDLANVRSVMAIQTEDLGVQVGDGFGLIGRAALTEPRGCSLMQS